MNIKDKIEEMLNENNIHYFKSQNTDEIIYRILYKGIENKEISAEILMAIDEQLELICFSFSKIYNKEKDIQEIKSELLDLNTDLDGSLAMKNDSDIIEYRFEYKLQDNEISFKSYNFCIINCLKVYEKLIKKELVVA